MEAIFIEIGIINLVISSLITTFIISAVTTLTKDVFQTEASKKLLVAIVALAVTLLNTSFVLGTFTDWQNTLLKFFLTWSFAVLFYTYLGKWTVNWFFEKLKSKLQKGEGDDR